MAKTKHITIHIAGMTCAACSNRVEKVLNRKEGVEANVNLTTEKASINYDPDMVTIEDIKETIERLGYQVAVEKMEIDISGMTCAACSNRIEKVLNRQEGVERASVNLAAESAVIEYHPGITSEDALIEVIEKLGYGAKAKSDREEKQARKSKEIKRMRIKLIASAILSFPLLVTMLDHLFGLPVPKLLMNPWFQFALATPVQFVIGWPFYKGAFRSLRGGSANMDVLVAMGTSAAYVYSIYEGIKAMTVPGYEAHLYFETSALLITLILFGKYLEANAKGRTKQALAALMKLQAKEARIIVDGVEKMIPVEEVKVGDLLLIKPGEKIPVDGIVVKGDTYVDESMLTGESIPIYKTVDDEVIGATLNKNGTIEMRAVKVGKDTALANIIQAVEEAQGSKAPIQRLADKISGIFVPIVVVIASVTFLTWLFFVSPNDFESALVAAIAVLVIACPCALGLATPTSIMVGTGKAAENGILFKGGEHLERTHLIDTVVFDKTGTITKGKPEVTDFTGDDELLMLAASVERGSEHPLAEAMVAYAVEKGVDLLPVESFKAVPGQGVKAFVSGKEVLVGSRRFMRNHGVDIEPYEDDTYRLEEEGKSVVLIAVDRVCKGIAAVADTVKETAKEAVEQLKAEGIDVLILTGDNERTAKAVGKAVGIDHVLAEVLPEDKANKIKELKAEGRNVAMVGDGINDAPALAEADIGIAIGTGTEVAIEAADVTILGGELLLIPKALKISRLTIRNIRQNLFWAFAYNSAGIPIAAAGLLAPWVAGAAMAFSSLSVVSNALRLKRMNIS
ncbi:MAG: copper-translocating P-type ATPase [Bacilli bacterium]|nr:copper-translocating P-type ATPase [Bacilli bacterium]